MVRLREASPALNADNLPDIDLDLFDWSLLNTPVSKVDLGEREPEEDVISRCTKRLQEIERNIRKMRKIAPQGLKTLVERTRVLITKDWAFLKLYIDDNAEYPDDVALWSYAEWRRCDLVDFFMRICGLYFGEVLTAGLDEVTELMTDELDEEFLSLINDILALDANEKGFVGIKEWERWGTKATLETEKLSKTEFDPVTSRPLDPETGEPIRDEYSDSDSDSEPDTFDGEKMEEALEAIPRHGVDAPAPPVVQRWSVELPSRDKPS